MDKWLLFAGDAYYPIGGFHDFVGSYTELEKAKEAAWAAKLDWWHIVNGNTGQIVATN